MAKRETVKINHDIVRDASKQHHWSLSTLSNMLGKHRTWLADVKMGRNLPSPEEAARMCAILQVNPEEILTVPEDIEKVRALINEQKKLTLPSENELFKKIGSLTNENRAKLEDYLEFLINRQDSQ